LKQRKKRVSDYIPILLASIVLENIIEFIFINSIIDARSLPQAPAFDALFSNHFSYFNYFIGYFQRPFGLGGLPSVTAPLTVSLLFLYLGLEKKKTNMKLVFASLLSIFLSASGAGYMVLLVVSGVWFFLKRKALFVLFVCSATILFACLQAFPFFQFTLFQKISPAYIQFLIKTALIILSNFINSVANNPIQLYLGNPELVSTDSAFIGFFIGQGIIVFLFYFFAISFLYLKYPVMKIRQGEYRLGLLALIIGTFHYPVLFYVPTQVLLGGLIAEGLLDKRFSYRSDCQVLESTPNTSIVTVKND
jgi:hypothetical protein